MHTSTTLKHYFVPKSLYSTACVTLLPLLVSNTMTAQQNVLSFCCAWKFGNFEGNISCVPLQRHHPLKATFEDQMHHSVGRPISKFPSDVAEKYSPLFLNLEDPTAGSLTAQTISRFTEQL